VAENFKLGGFKMDVIENMEDKIERGK